MIEAVVCLCTAVMRVIEAMLCLCVAVMQVVEAVLCLCVAVRELVCCFRVSGTTCSPQLSSGAWWSMNRSVLLDIFDLLL